MQVTRILMTVDDPGARLVNALIETGADSVVIDGVRTWVEAPSFSEFMRRVATGGGLVEMANLVSTYSKTDALTLQRTLRSALEFIEAADVERDDGEPAVYTYTRLGGALWLMTLVPVAVLYFHDFSALFSIIMGIIVMVFCLPVGALALLPRRPLIATAMLVVAGVTMISYVVFAPHGIYLLHGITRPAVKEWFNGRKLRVDAARATRTGYIVLGLHVVLALILHAGMYQLTVWIGAYLDAENERERVARLSHVRFMKKGKQRAVYVKEGYSEKPRFRYSALPRVANAGTYLKDGGKWTIDEHSRATAIYIWASWCPDCDTQLRQLPTPSERLDVVLATLDCDNNGMDNRDEVKAKLRTSGVADDIIVVCTPENAWPASIQWTPSMLVADDEGMMRFWYEGPVSSQLPYRVLDHMNTSEKMKLSED